MRLHVEELDEEFLKAIEAFEINFVDQQSTEDDLLPDDYLVCECSCVDVLTIREQCKNLDDLNEDFLSKHLGMGKGCRNCLNTMPFWKERIFKKI